MLQRLASANEPNLAFDERSELWGWEHGEQAPRFRARVRTGLWTSAALDDIAPL